MRKSISIVLLTFCFAVFGQEYYPMLGETNEWFVLHSFEGSITRSFSTTGDTIVNEKAYKVLGTGMGNIYAFLREDTLERKVFALIPTLEDSAELVYLDFSLEEDDSIKITTLQYWMQSWYWVDSIRIVSTTEGPRRAFYLKGNENEYGYFEYPVWIEGVGSIGHPVWRGTTPSEWNSGELNCLFRDGIKVYQSPKSVSYGSCAIYLDIKDYSSNRNIDIYPNPASNRINISYQNELPKSVEIYDYLGKLVKMKRIPTEVNISSLPNGIYILVFKFENDVSTKKLIIEK